MIYFCSFSFLSLRALFLARTEEIFRMTEYFQICIYDVYSPFEIKQRRYEKVQLPTFQPQRSLRVSPSVCVFCNGVPQRNRCSLKINFLNTFINRNWVIL